MDRSHTRQQLGQILDQEIQAAGDLLESLAGEFEALRTNNPDAIDAAGTAKRERIERLELLEHERKDVCLACGYSIEESGVAAMLAWCDEDNELTSRWNALLNLIGKCRTANEVSGQVVTMQRRRVQLALRLLHGRSNEPGVYGPTGEATSKDAGRSIATA